jgi:hypothetical protein
MTTICLAVTVFLAAWNYFIWRDLPPGCRSDGALALGVLAAIVNTGLFIWQAL